MNESVSSSVGAQQPLLVKFHETVWAQKTETDKADSGAHRDYRSYHRPESWVALCNAA